MTKRCRLEKMFINSSRMDTKLQYHHMQMPQVCMNHARILMRKDAVVQIFLIKGISPSCNYLEQSKESQSVSSSRFSEEESCHKIFEETMSMGGSAKLIGVSSLESEGGLDSI